MCVIVENKKKEMQPHLITVSSRASDCKNEDDAMAIGDRAIRMYRSSDRTAANTFFTPLTGNTIITTGTSSSRAWRFNIKKKKKIRVKLFNESKNPYIFKKVKHTDPSVKCDSKQGISF